MATESLHNCSLQIDDTFGPWAGSCRGGFDFTLLFEETILNIAPLGLVIILACLRLLILRKSQKKVVGSLLLVAKLIGWAVFSIFQLIILVIRAKFSTYNTRASLPSTVLSLVGALILSLLSYTEHERCVRPSPIISAYLFFTVLLDIAQTRTLWLLGSGNLVVVLATVSFGIKCLLLVLESIEKRTILAPHYQNDAPEATTGMFGRSVFWWLNSLLLKGSRQLLSLEDLLPLDRQLYSETLHQKFQDCWSSADQKSPHSLVGIAIRVMKWPLLAGVLPRVCLIGFNFAQPFLITRAVHLASSPVATASDNVGYGLIGAYALVYIGIAISTGQYQHKTYRVVTMLRGSFVSSITAKTLELSLSDAKAAAAITLMSTDIERISSGSIHLHEIWANSIEVAISAWLLYRQLGAACAIPLGVAIFSTIGAGVVSAFVAQNQKAWIEATQKRVATTAAILEMMKGLKLAGLVDFAFSTVSALRVHELQISRKFRRLLIWTMAISYVTPVVAPILTFTVFALVSRSNPESSLNIAKAFTSLSLLSILTGSMTSLIISIPSIVSVISCFDRIQDYFSLEPQTDSRLTEVYSLPTSPDTGTTPSPEGLVDEKKYPAAQQTEFSTDGSTPTEELKEHDVYSPSSDAIFVENGSFGWVKDAEPVLKNINIRIHRGDLTIICGPVGCGKSTLLKALLGELPLSDGTIRISFSEAAYCEQGPWLPHGTIQESVIGALDFNESWYESVINACALKEDFKFLSQGDQSSVGSNGIVLSGGQKQRLALARAVYSRNELVILDDMLSGLDADTENLVFNRLLGQDGLLRKSNKTVVMTSSSVKRLPYADKIIILGNDGAVKEEGKFEDLFSQKANVSAVSDDQPWSTKDGSPGDDSLERSPTEEDSENENEDAPVLPDLNTAAAAADAVRRTGDWSVYMYYLGSMGWIGPTVFIFMMFAFAFCTTFPSKLLLSKLPLILT